jgi:hypothetical protein
MPPENPQLAVCYPRRHTPMGTYTGCMPGGVQTINERRTHYLFTPPSFHADTKLLDTIATSSHAPTNGECLYCLSSFFSRGSDPYYSS